MQQNEARDRQLRASEWEEEADYATLAKAGGRKDLLCHMEFVRTRDQPLPYPRVDWFDHPSPPPPPHSPPSPPLPSQDSPLRWKATPPTSQLPRIARKRLPRPQPSPPKHKTIKLPPIETPVSFGMLLAMDYQKEWLENNNRRMREERRRSKARREAQRQKLAEHTLRGRQRLREEETKPRFIMKRFANVPSRLKLPPLS